jgi:hypothetical protein
LALAEENLKEAETDLHQKKAILELQLSELKVFENEYDKA